MPSPPTAPLLRILRIVLGTALFAVGVVLLFFPGPGLPLMALGLGLIHPPLGRRFQDWLRKMLQRYKRRAHSPKN